ncbi:MAG TPA: trypsin-like peptidase domain-containing protein [Humibacter sp.]|jgi:S1-C subfamily serine protease|nr:trypsin-like peptidase domain-containing protein [Humibacter sp.]
MSNQTQRRHLAGWITAAAAATAVFTIGGAALSFATVDTVVSALSASSASHGSSERTGYYPYGGSSGSEQTPGGSGSGSGSGSSTTSSGTAATASQEKGVAIIDTVLQYDNAEAAGTGIVLTSNGEILTNNHVVEGSTSIKVTIASTGKTYAATVVGTDATDDVAVLQLTGASGLTKASIDSSGSVSTGDDVTAVGNAGGTGTLTAASGSVTGTDKTITTQAEEAVASETLNGLIETDAAIEAGDSGGPLYDASGDIIGIDTAASSNTAESDGYAIPIEDALGIADQIASGEASSTVTIGLPAFLGVEVAADGSTTGGDGTGLGNGGGTSTTVSGAQIAQVIDGTAAASAGLEAGDTITAVNGTAISSSDGLTATLAQLKPGSSASISYTDATGASNTVTVTLGSGPAA